jgi:UDP-N-acetylglucosamine enolpyruvyl transferase
VPQLGKIPLIIQITLTPAWPAEGQTLSTNAAVEPEIIDLMDLLKEMATNSKTEVNKKQITIVIHGGCCFI